MNRLSVLCVLAPVGAFVCTGAQTAPSAVSEKCQAALPADWHCMHVNVPEQYGVASARTAQVHIVVAPAQKPALHRKAVFYLQGGPGLSGTLVAGRGFVNSLGPLQTDHDLVVVDQRGVSGPDTLLCPPESPAKVPASFAADPYSVKHAAACRAQFEKKLDLTSLNTENFARDLESVRSALGYERVALYGDSYGTLIAQDYMRFYPGRTDAAVLADILPLDDPYAAAVPTGTAASFEAVLAACDKDQPCHTAFPALRKEYATLMQRLVKGGIDATLDGDPPQTVHLGGGAVLNWFLLHFHFMKNVASIPYEIHTLVSGDAKVIAPIVRQILNTQGLYYTYASLPEHLSVTCIDQIPFIDATPPAKTSVDKIQAGQLDAKRAACRVWPRKTAKSAALPVAPIDTPVLVIAADISPVAPPQVVKRAERSFANVRTLVLANHGESFDQDWNICPKPEAVAFIASGGTARIDTACGSQFPFPPFRLD